MAGNKTATFLVIFVVSIVAFCLACVCASMTGQISILPDDNTTNEFMDNVTNITEDMINRDDTSYDDYSYSDSNDYSDSQVETTVDDNSHDNSDSKQESESGHDQEHSSL